MRILFNIGHPAQVHLFKNLIWNLENKGHDYKITVIDKDVSSYLLKVSGFNYEIVGTAKSSLFSKATELIKIEYNLYKIAKSFKPDILVGGVGNAYVAHVGRLLRIPSIVFDDSEHAKISHLLMDPFADVICTPSCFMNNIGKNQIRYNGYHQLAYLHPNYFKPDPDILNDLGLCKEDKFVVMRLVAWDADHDIGQKGIQNKKEFVRQLEKYGRVLITAEGKLDKELEKYKIKVSPEKIHNLLYYASLYVGEGATMATESAILGTPSIYISSLVGTMGNFVELEQKYGLVFSYNHSYEGLNKAIELLKEHCLKDVWSKKQDLLFREKIDVTAFMVWFIENYPQSFTRMKNNEITSNMCGINGQSKR
jgi:predicted glycosyltransferase